MNTSLGQFNPLAIAFFLLAFVAHSALPTGQRGAPKAQSSSTLPGGNITGQNGLALAGDFMSAASFLASLGWWRSTASTD